MLFKAPKKYSTPVHFFWKENLLENTALMLVIFKSSMEKVHRFTLSIRMNSEMVCAICKAEGQFLPHGWLYKTDADGSLCKVDKRIICDRRRGGKGCGATVRGLVSTETYQLWAVTATLMLIEELLSRGTSSNQKVAATIA